MLNEKIETGIEVHKKKLEKFQKEIRIEEGTTKDPIKLDYLKANYHYEDGIIMGLRLALKFISEEE